MFEEDIPEYVEKVKKKFEEDAYFLEQNLGSDVHWFFQQGLAALKLELYLAACSSFIIGIEASLRVTQAQVENPSVVDELDPVKTLSNRLLNDARANGLPIELLAFPGETDFEEKLGSKKRNNNVEIVRIRHNFCHGNVLEHRNSELGEDNRFFTPECVRDLSNALYQLSKQWTSGLGEFRKSLQNV